jgi:hypothetical protein
MKDLYCFFPDLLAQIGIRDMVVQQAFMFPLIFAKDAGCLLNSGNYNKLSKPERQNYKGQQLE